jgi:hypothetical protein
MHLVSGGILVSMPLWLFSVVFFFVSHFMIDRNSWFPFGKHRVCSRNTQFTLMPKIRYVPCYVIDGQTVYQRLGPPFTRSYYTQAVANASSCTYRPVAESHEELLRLCPSPTPHPQSTTSACSLVPPSIPVPVRGAPLPPCAPRNLWSKKKFH